MNNGTSKIINLAILFGGLILLSIAFNFFSGNYSTKGKINKALQGTIWNFKPGYWDGRGYTTPYFDFENEFFGKDGIRYMDSLGHPIYGNYELLNDGRTMNVEWKEWTGRGTERWRVQIDNYREPQELTIRFEDGSIIKLEPAY